MKMVMEVVKMVIEVVKMVIEVVIIMQARQAHM